MPCGRFGGVPRFGAVPRFGGVRFRVPFTGLRRAAVGREAELAGLRVEGVLRAYPALLGTEVCLVPRDLSAVSSSDSTCLIRAFYLLSSILSCSSESFAVSQSFLYRLAAF